MTKIDTCSFCEIILRDCDRPTCWDLCNEWIHFKCVDLKLNALI